MHVKHTKRILCDKSLRTPVNREYCLGRCRDKTCINNKIPTANIKQQQCKFYTTRCYNQNNCFTAFLHNLGEPVVETIKCPNPPYYHSSPQ